MDRPSGLPVVLILESRSHLDLGDLTNLLAAELGVMTVRLERAIRSLDGVERVHVNRWGDGAAHFHMWFLARPVGQLQLRGSFLSLWDDILEPIPESQWRESLAHVAAWLADFGGRSLAEPPRIEWLTPSHFGEVSDFDDEGTAVNAQLAIESVEAKTSVESASGRATVPVTAAPRAAGSSSVAPAAAGASADDSAGDSATRDGGGQAALSENSDPAANDGARSGSFDLDDAGWGLTDDEIESSDILSR